MKKIFAILFLIFSCRTISLSQDSLTANSPIILLDDSIFNNFTLRTNLTFYPSAYDSVIHFPTADDTINIKKLHKFIDREPTKKNIEKYFQLASSLWELSRVEESERMFLKIMNSKDPYFDITYHQSSGMAYNYGGFTSNRKNETCIFLAKINIEKKNFEQGLSYLQTADTLYPVAYYCGTCYQFEKAEKNGLYSLCYLGLGKYDDVISLLLPDYKEGNKTLITAIRKSYSKMEIDSSLKIAEASIVCKVDSTQSNSIIYENYGEENEKETEIRYTTGIAFVNLFGRKIYLERPELQEGEIINKGKFIKEFKESYFYTTLSENKN